MCLSELLFCFFFFLFVCLLFFFFKQKTAYEMCGRDWSSDVCSSDLSEQINAMQAEIALLRTERTNTGPRSEGLNQMPTRIRNEFLERQNQNLEDPESTRDRGEVNQIGRASCRERV